MEKSIKTRLKNLLLHVPGFQALCRRLTRDHVRVIMYHRFSPEGQDHPRRLPFLEFAWQLTYLERHHLVWTPDEQLDNSGRQFPAAGGPPVVITVDDGYADFATVAFPLLQIHNLPATIFVTTGFLSGQTWFWWDRLIWLLEHCTPGDQAFHVANQRTQGDPGKADQRWKLWHTIADHLSTINDEEKESALADLASNTNIQIPTTAPRDYKALTWNQVREMTKHRITFGAHTITHPVLSRVNTAKAEQEIRESRNQIAVETGSTPDWFCYPQGGPGDFLSDTVEQVRRAGYRGCYTAFPNPFHDGDPMTLPRYSISEDRLAFQWILCGAEYLVSRRMTWSKTRKGSV